MAGPPRRLTRVAGTQVVVSKRRAAQERRVADSNLGRPGKARFEAGGPDCSLRGFAVRPVPPPWKRDRRHAGPHCRRPGPPPRRQRDRRLPGAVGRDACFINGGNREPLCADPEFLRHLRQPYPRGNCDPETHKPSDGTLIASIWQRQPGCVRSGQGLPLASVWIRVMPADLWRAAITFTGQSCRAQCLARLQRINRGDGPANEPPRAQRSPHPLGGGRRTVTAAVVAQRNRPPARCPDTRFVIPVEIGEHPGG